MTRNATSLPVLALVLAILPAPSAGAQSLKIGVFDPSKIQSDSKMGQRLQDELNRFRVEREADIKQRSDEYKKLVDQYKTGVGNMSPERREQIEADLTQRGRDLERLQRDAEADLKRRLQKATRDLEEAAAPVIVDFARQNGYTVVFSRDQVTYALDTIDITAELVRLLDAKAK